VEQGKLALDTPVSAIVPDIPNGDRITIRNLLEENSGLPDINSLPNYDQILHQHQTAASLVQYIQGKPPLSEPGGASKAEEHSAFNLLALIVEKKTGLPFAQAEQSLIFKPLGMRSSGIDDDSDLPKTVARGYAPKGAHDIAPAETIRWSAKTGNASAYASAHDLLAWADALFSDRLLSAQSRETMLDYSKSRVGYGWFKSVSKRFGVPMYYMNGRAPGFASFMVRIPSEKLTVIVLSNIYASVPTTMGFDLVALELNKPLDPLQLPASPPPPMDVAAIAGAYRFGADFYQPNTALNLTADEGDAVLHWADGSTSALIPIGGDRFIDRAYWVGVSIHRDAAGRPDALVYDRFTGARQ